MTFPVGPQGQIMPIFSQVLMDHEPGASSTTALFPNHDQGITPSPSQLAQLEALATDMFSPRSSPSARSSARVALTPFSSSFQCIIPCQTILDQSSSPEALFFALTSLHDLISLHFSQLTSAQTVSLRGAIARFITSAARSSQPSYIKSAAIRLLSRLTKLAWLDDPEHRRICEVVITPILSTDPGLALDILMELIEDMFSTTRSMTLNQNRRTASAFRVFPLHDIAGLSIDMINRCVGPIRLAAMKVLFRALNANSTVPLSEEPLDDHGSLMLPDSWANSVARPDLIKLIVSLVTRDLSDPNTAVLIGILSALARIRRSLWPSVEIRQQWLQELLTTVQILIQNASNLLCNQENQILMTRLLYNIKATFQLSDLVALSSANHFFLEIYNITTIAFTQWANLHATTLLLKFWSAIAKARRSSPSSEIEMTIDTYMGKLALLFVQVQSDPVNIQRCYQEHEREVIVDQLEHYQTLFRLNMPTMMSTWKNLFDNALAQNQVYCQSWLIALGSHIVSQQKTYLDSRLSQLDTVRGQGDAEVTYRVLQVMAKSARQLNAEIDIEVMVFIDELRQMYLVDGSRVVSTSQRSMNESFYEKLSSLCGQPMSSHVLAASILSSMGGFIVAYGKSNHHEHTRIVEMAGDMIEIFTTSQSGLALLRETNIGNIIMSTTRESISLPLRRRLFSCIGYCLMSSLPDHLEDDDYKDYMAPHWDNLFRDRLNGIRDIDDTTLARYHIEEIVSLINDITGIVHSVSIHMKFEHFWLYLEPYSPMLYRIMSTHIKSAKNVSSLLRLLQVMTQHNTNPFRQGSCTGLQMVKAIAPALIVFAAHAIREPDQGSGTAGASPTSIQWLRPSAATPSSPMHEAGSSSTPRETPGDEDDDSVACVEMFLSVVQSILSGIWAEVGVMALYGDMTIRELIKRALQMIVHGPIPLADIAAIATLKGVFLALSLTLTEQYMELVAADLDQNDRHQFTMTIASVAIDDGDSTSAELLARIVGWNHNRDLRKNNGFVSDESVSQLMNMALDACLFDGGDPIRFSIILLPMMTRNQEGVYNYKIKLCQGNNDPNSIAAINQAFTKLLHGLHSNMSLSRSNQSILAENIPQGRFLLRKAYIKPVII